VALAAEVHQATRARWGHDDLPAGFELVNRAFADRTTMVLVLCVPLFALVAAPRRLGLPVLAGWLGGAAAIAVSTFGYARYSEGARSAPALCFALAVLVIAVVAVVAALRPEPTPSGRGAGGALAGLAVAVLLGSSGGAAVAFQAASWPRDDSLRHLLASADGRIYVTRGSAVFTVDTTLHKVVGQAVPGGAEMNAIAVTPDGSRLYTSSGDAVRMIDKSTGRSQFIAVAAAGQMAVSHDGRRLYAGAGDHVSIIDTRAQEVVGFAGNDLASLGALAVSPDGGRLYVSRYGHGVSVIDTKTNRVTGNPIPAGQQSDRMVLNQNGSRLYVGTVNDGVFVIDTAAKAATGRPIRGERPLLSPGGDRLYVIDGDYVAVIDPKTMKALGDPIPAGFLPVDTALSPDGRYLFVSHYRGDSVWMIDTTTRRTVGIPIPAGRS
jgi:YVTN family beta-propeller protein